MRSVLQPAYIDAGSGALLWQALVALVVGAAFQLRRVTDWVRRALGFSDKRR